ncbi:MAG TPA: YceI family protein, partial [Bryobacteraceae bacterium]|nr:YceI family protein [Bryobacteraceae bacterium]
LEVFKSGLLAGKKHLFFFEDYQGELDYDAARVENSQVRLTIQARSLTCKDNWVRPQDRKTILDAALNDMMAVNQYPQISFVSSRVVTKSKGQYEVQGDLTVRGIAKPVTLQAAVKPVGDVRLEIDGDARISHQDYGLKPLSKFGGIVGTKDQMLLRFLVWAEKQQ